MACLWGTCEIPALACKPSTWRKDQKFRDTILGYLKTCLKGLERLLEWSRVLAALTKEPATLSSGSQSLSPAPGDQTPLAF